MAKRSVGLLSVVTVVLIVIVVGAAVVAVDRLGSGPENIPSAVPGSDGDDPGPAVSTAAGPVERNRIVVDASSRLAPADGLTYDPENTLDGDLSTAWNSSVTEGEGRGESLTYRFSEPVNLTAIRFVNGYAKSPEVFANNHRIKTVVVRSDANSHEVTLLDTDEEQEIAFDFGLTSKVVLEVSDVYLGDGFEQADISTDLALTEIEFIAG